MFKENRSIDLPCGGKLEIGLSDSFLEKLRSYYDLPKFAEITDKHIKDFLFKTLESTIDNLPTDQTINTKLP